ncbi:RhoGAP-domain-containing protein [Auriscalpium vulgare]|uniref:RhoGAP-domain-containing protein n=1 Tax=Auriscalpium vulgare TaxID=40419 RepID=A0ACB8S6Q8_9AGAM|nr:RhoGAP-domain-containing protein [Auriscalpium vulgare]
MLPKSPKPLSLKQRLAALTQAPGASAPSSPVDPSPKSPGAKRRFNAPWAKRTNSQDTYDHYDAEDKLQETISKMIYQAGVDYETRPMVVLNASAMPDTRDVNYDALLVRILHYLDLYVESDYAVVFFAAGSKNTPGWNWVWKAYRSLSRKYRKNLKRLYIVHSNFFSKMLFSLAGAFISPKFFRKITYIDTLSDLAHHVPLTQIDVPPAVYQENLKREREIRLPIPTHANLFGVHLEELMGYDGEKGGIPRVVKDCIQYLRETGLTDVGLFRRSPNSALLRQVQDAYDRGHVVTLDNFNDPHLAAVLLKKYIRDLPEPLFPEALYPVIQRCPAPTDDPSDWSALLYIRETLLPALPRCNYILLSHYLHLMHEVSLRSAVNRMDAHNLTVVLCPNLISSPSPVRDIMMCAVPGSGPALHPSLAASPTQEDRTTLGMIIKLCIQRYYEVFDEIQDPAEALAPARRFADNTGSSASSSPRSPSIHLPQKRQSVLSKGSSNRDSRGFDDDDSIDDAMLVMPIGPAGAAAPSAWNTPGSTAGTSTFRPRHRTGLSGGGSQSPRTPLQSARSMHTVGGTGGVYGAGTVSRARSTISIDKAGSAGGTLRKGSISVGHGTTRKASGAAVSAVGVTASGFFTPPSEAPPVPAVPRRTGVSEGAD